MENRMKRSNPAAMFLILIAAQFLGQMCQAQLRVDNLRCENLANPLGLDAAAPRLSWQIQSQEKNVLQTAYELRVSEEEPYAENKGALIWNSGKVASDSSVHVVYKGPRLQTDMRYYWQVRVWDNKGQSSPWSDMAYWQMGLLDRSDWKAHWIEQGTPADTLKASPLFRKSFTLNKKIKSATAYITCRGIYEAFINGRRIGDAFFAPGWTDYYTRLQYQAYDVTDLLRQSNNVIGVVLGGGWYGKFYGNGRPLSLLCQLVIHYADGTTDVVLSDDSWKCSTGATRKSEIFAGGIFDARQEKKGWTTAGFDDASWSGVAVRDTVHTRLTGTYVEPIREHETLRPTKIFVTPKGARVIDFGQMLAGWVRFKVRGNPGDTVKISHAATLDKEGNFYTANLWGEKVNTYVLSGDGEEICEPHFTYQGFRYIKVDGYRGELQPENFTAVAAYADLKETGMFACSDSLVNLLQRNVQWTQKSNFFSVPTATCDRDERLGWVDTQHFSRIAAFNMGVNNFYAKWIGELGDGQLPDGMVLLMAPNISGPIDGKPAGGIPGWGDAITTVPWNMYLAYGDRRILEELYPKMKAWVGYMDNLSTDHLWNTGLPWWTYGDWLHYEGADPSWAGWGPAAPTDVYLIGQCYFGHSIQVVINTAKVLGRTEDVAKYTDLLQKVKAAFVKEYLTPNGRLAIGTQTAYTLALHFNMLPEALQQQAAKRLVDNLTIYQGHFTTGELGVQYIAPVLARFGYADTAYKLLLQKSYPSWLYPVTRGATTLWERWDTIKPDSTFANPVMNSFDLPAMGGSVADWLYREVAGIDTDPEGAGYKHIRIRPHLPSNSDSGFRSARASLETYYGRISSSWNITGKQVTLDVEIPPNTRATVYVPAREVSSVSEGGTKLSLRKDLQVSGMDDGFIIVNVGSGAYRFAAAR